MAEEKLNMLAEFPAISSKAWKEKIVADLKGADFDKKLVWRTSEGFNVQPYYRQEDLKGLKTTVSAPGQFPYVRGTKPTTSGLSVKTFALPRTHAKLMLKRLTS